MVCLFGNKAKVGSFGDTEKGLSGNRYKVSLFGNNGTVWLFENTGHGFVLVLVSDIFIAIIAGIPFLLTL